LASAACRPFLLGRRFPGPISFLVSTNNWLPSFPTWILLVSAIYSLPCNSLVFGGEPTTRGKQVRRKKHHSGCLCHNVKARQKFRSFSEMSLIQDAVVAGRFGGGRRGCDRLFSYCRSFR